MSFSPADLHVVSCVFNPMRWQSRIKHALPFIKHMLDSGVFLTLVVTELGERPFDPELIALENSHPRLNIIWTRASTMAWSKESAINVGIRSRPEAKYVAWIDADVTFTDPNWVVETLHALQVQPVVQPWSQALDLGPNGEIMTVKNRQVQTSFGWVYRETGRILKWWENEQAYDYPHSGYGWAATMLFLDAVGLLLDFSGLGAADHQMSLGMTGNIEAAVHGLSTPAYKAAVKAWGDKAFSACQGHVGYVPGRIEHAFHGSKSARAYVSRWDILNEHQFDPHTDLHRNRYGILELSNNKPQLRRDIERYFSTRAEDDNVNLG